MFNRLLGDASNRDAPTPLTPAELLISLHTIDGAKVDLKYVIKATSLCFAETGIYTQEVITKPVFFFYLTTVFSALFRFELFNNSIIMVNALVTVIEVH